MVAGTTIKAANEKLAYAFGVNQSTMREIVGFTSPMFVDEIPHQVSFDDEEQENIPRTPARRCLRFGDEDGIDKDAKNTFIQDINKQTDKQGFLDLS